MPSVTIWPMSKESLTPRDIRKTTHLLWDTARPLFCLASSLPLWESTPKGKECSSHTVKLVNKECQLHSTSLQISWFAWHWLVYKTSVHTARPHIIVTHAKKTKSVLWCLELLVSSYWLLHFICTPIHKYTYDTFFCPKYIIASFERTALLFSV